MALSSVYFELACKEAWQDWIEGLNSCERKTETITIEICEDKLMTKEIHVLI